MCRGLHREAGIGDAFHVAHLNDDLAVRWKRARLVGQLIVGLTLRGSLYRLTGEPRNHDQLRIRGVRDPRGELRLPG